MAGVKWKFATQSRSCPTCRADAGLVFPFPRGAQRRGPGGARGGGANYFFFDWLGLGIEADLSLGRIDFDASYHGSHGYAMIDFGGGVEFQFYRTADAARDPGPCSRKTVSSLDVGDRLFGVSLVRLS